MQVLNSIKHQKVIQQSPASRPLGLRVYGNDSNLRATSTSHIGEHSRFLKVERRSGDTSEVKPNLSCKLHIRLNKNSPIITQLEKAQQHVTSLRRIPHARMLVMWLQTYNGVMRQQNIPFEGTDLWFFTVPILVHFLCARPFQSILFPHPEKDPFQNERPLAVWFQ